MRLGDKLKKNFANNLQNLRTQQNLTQAKLAEKLNEKYGREDLELQRTSIVNYETGNTMPKIDALYCISRYFGKSIDQMISATMASPMFGYQLPEADMERGPADIAKSGENEEVIRFLHQDTHINKILSTCVNGIVDKQFHLEFEKTLYEKLMVNASTEEEKAKFDQLFFKTFLSCINNKTQYIQAVAESILDTPQELEIFMAFKDPSIQVETVAKAYQLSEEEVIAIFNTVQNKVSSKLGGKT